MEKPKLIRITTVPLSLEKLLEGQLSFMQQFFEVTAVSSGKEQLLAFGKQEGIATFYLPLTRKIAPFNDLRSFWKLYRFLKREKPQIVHSHTPKAGIVGMLAAYFAKVPFRLHTVAGLPLMEATGLKRVILNDVEKWTYRFSTRVYPNSKGLYDFILAEKFISKKKLKIIGNGSSNGINTASFSKEHFSEEELEVKKQELGISSLDFVFVFVGRIVKDKGVNEMVAAFVMLQTKNSNCSLLLVGHYENDLDPITEETKTQISENLKIITIGYQNDVRIYFGLSDALIFPSYREGFPNVVMQAGSMGLPCIVSDINGCNEIIQDNLNGIIVPVKDVEKLFEAMDLLLNDQALYQRLALKSRSNIANRYEQMGIWKALLSEYQCL
jgi:glycosyltransferase involved in cell wall biosynthesis